MQESEPQTFAVLIQKGTRVTDASNTLVWDTQEDVYVAPGETYADVKVLCQKKGKCGNGFSSRFFPTALLGIF